MSVPRKLLTGVLSHDATTFMAAGCLDIYTCAGGEDVRPGLETLNDLMAHFDLSHALYCDCGLKLGPQIWYASLPYGQDCHTALAWYVPNDEDLLDGSQPLSVLSSLDLPIGTIHLIFGTEKPLAKPFPLLSSGLRRLGGDLCRVAGSHERSLPETADFAEIARKAGCFYIDRHDWIMERLGGLADETSFGRKFPIIRRPSGFGKSTFLSNCASYFDMAADHSLFPEIRVLGRSHSRSMLVFHMDFGQLCLTEDMSDERMGDECTRLMWDAAERFCRKYEPLLGEDPVDIAAVRANKIPSLVVMDLAVKYGRKVFVAIDNYTAPFMTVVPQFYGAVDKQSAFFRIQTAMRLNIFDDLYVDIACGIVTRGLITGTVLPADGRMVMPFEKTFLFPSHTEDLSWLPDHANIIGFTRSDVEELVRSYLGVEDSRVAEVAARLVPVRLRERLDSYSELITIEDTYAARDVLDAIRNESVASSAGPSVDSDSEWHKEHDLPPLEPSTVYFQLHSIRGRRFI